MLKRFFGGIAFAAVTVSAMLLIAGGQDLLRRPIAAGFLLLWGAWWVATALGMRAGIRSVYERGNLLISVTAISGVLALAIVPVWEYSRFSGPIPRDWPLSWAGLALFAAGVTLQSLAMLSLRGLYTFRVGTDVQHKQVTTGPYRLVRHPGYLSYIITLTGITLALSSLTALGLMLGTLVFVVLRIQREEKQLIARHGEAYLSYTRKTRWRLIPGIY